MGLFNTTVDTKRFDREQWRSTYDARDLEPNIIQHELRDMFTFDSSDRRWKYNTDVSLSGGASCLDLISAEAKVKGSYSTEGLEKLLREHSLHTDITGNVIVVKSLDVQRVNMAAFGENTNVFYIRTFLSPSKEFAHRGELELGRAVPDRKIYPNIGVRVDEISDREAGLKKSLDELSARVRLSEIKGAPPGVILAWNGGGEFAGRLGGL